MRPALLVVLTCASACGGAVDAGGARFATEPSQVVRSTSGGLELRLFEAVDRPVARGVNEVRIEVSPEQEALDLVPWMPVMGHGATVKPTVERDESGFVVTQLTLPMPGSWELRCALHGAVDDDAIFSVTVR